MDAAASEIRADTANRNWRLGIILSGSIADETNFLRIVSSCDYIVCADGGCRHLRPFGILPDLLIGDMDSISSPDRYWLEKAQVPVNQFPLDKDYTDSELAVESAVKLLESELQEQGIDRPANGRISIYLLAATGNRPDHVLGNQMMAARLAREQYDVMLSDGSSWFYIMQGPASRTFDASAYPLDSIISVVALSDKVAGINYKGLKYPLDNYDLMYGSQRGVSNSLAEPHGDSFNIEIASGTLMVIITAAD